MNHAAEHAERIVLTDALDAFKRNISRMSGLAERAVADALTCVAHDNHELARSVIKNDRNVDILEHQTSALAVNTIGLQQPVAHDLRACLGTLKVVSSIERIADQAKSLAKHLLKTPPPPKDETFAPFQRALQRLGEPLIAQIRAATEAFVHNDPKLAKDVLDKEGEVDHLYESILREFLTYMIENPPLISGGARYLLMAKKLERAADHCENIAEVALYVVTGFWSYDDNQP